MSICVLMCAVSLGFFTPSYDDARWEANRDTVIQARFGDDLYAWISYDDDVNLTLQGQGFSKVSALGAGLGFRHNFANSPIYGFAELGYFEPDPQTTKVGIRDEAVWTRLVFEHGRGGRPDWHPEHTRHRLKGVVGGRFGVGYQVRDWFAIEVRRTFRSYREQYDACTGDDPKCQYPVAPGEKHWQNGGGLPAHGYEIGAVVTF